MPTITLITDLGKDTHQVAKVKMALQKAVGNAQIVDISHDVSPFAIDEAVYLLSTCLDDFPPDTLHLVAVDMNIARHKQLAACRWKNQLILSSDNGFLSMLLKEEKPDFYTFSIDSEGLKDHFPLKNILPGIVKNILESGLEKAGKKVPEIVVKYLEKPLIEEDLIRGQVVYVNNYHNSITNITKSDFESARKGRRFEVVLNRFDRITTLSHTYTDVREGENACFFNENGHLEIAVNHGKASQLIGLEKGKRVTVEFYADGPVARNKPAGMLNL